MIRNHKKMWCPMIYNGWFLLVKLGLKDTKVYSWNLGGVAGVFRASFLVFLKTADGEVS